MNPNNLTQEQIKQGYSTIPGAYDPLTGKLKTPTSNVITPQSLQPVTPIQGLPTTPVPTVPTAPTAPVVQPNITETMLKTLESDKTEAQKVEETGISEILKSMQGLTGEAQALATEKEKAGFNILRQDLQGINSQILKKQAELKQDDIQLISNMRAEERRDTLLPFAQMGQAKLAGDAQIVRALKNAEIGVLNATAIAKQGDIALAQQTAEEAVAVKYAPYKENIKRWEDTLKVIEPLLTRDEKKQAEAQKIKGQLAMREIEKAEENEKAIQSIALKIAEFGGNPAIIKNAKTPLEAIQLAGSKLQDPIQKLQMQKLNLDIQRQVRENALIGQPTATERKAEAKALASKEGQNLVLQDKLSLIDTIKKSSGISTRVGSNILARKPTSFWGGVGKALTGVGIPGLISGGVKEATGTGQQFSGAVHRLASQEFIDNLIEAKSQGATFGALTDREGDALRAAATQLNDWEIKDKDGKGTGVWNIDEKSFLQEVDRIEALSRKAIGDTFSQDEEQLFDSVFGSGTTLQADPSVYFNQ